MPPPRKRSHPRSLDALFGPAKPKIAPKRFCPKGHLQSVKWRPGDECWPCTNAARQAAEAHERQIKNAADRAAYREKHGNPAVITMTTWDTKRVIRMAIPPRLAAQRKAMDKRRGRRRGARI